MDVNRNGRIYPKDVLERAIAEFNARAAKGTVIGKIGQCDVRQSLADASHIVRSLRVTPSGDVAGTIELLDTPAGKTAKDLIQHSKIALRGVGTVDQNGVVQDDFKIESADIVLIPGEPPDVITLIGGIEDEATDEDDDNT